MTFVENGIRKRKSKTNPHYLVLFSSTRYPTKDWSAWGKKQAIKGREKLTWPPIFRDINVSSLHPTPDVKNYRPGWAASIISNGKVKQLKEEKSFRDPLCLEISLFSLSTRYPKFKTRAWMGCLHYSKWDDAFRSLENTQ